MNRMKIPTLIIPSLVSLYFLNGLLQGLNLFGKLSFPSALGKFLGVLPLFGHGFLLYLWIETSGGQNLDAWLMLSLTIWLMGLVVFFSFNEGLAKLNPIIFGLAGLTLFIYSQTHGLEVKATNAQKGVLFHILISFMATSVLFLSLGQSLILSLQTHLLRKNLTHPLLGMLPSLQQMENLLFYLVGFGFILLSISLVSGYFFVQGWFTPALLPKTLLATLAWVLFFVILFSRCSMGLRGSSAIHLTLLAGLLLFLSYFGTKFFLV